MDAAPNDVDLRRQLSTSYTKMGQILWVGIDVIGSLEFHGKALTLDCSGGISTLYHHLADKRLYYCHYLRKVCVLWVCGRHLGKNRQRFARTFQTRF